METGNRVDRRQFLSRAASLAFCGTERFAPAAMDEPRAPAAPEPYPATRRALTADLRPLATPGGLGAADARHLLRRAGFGPTTADVAEFTGLSPAAAVARLLDDALLAPVPPPPRSEEWLDVPPYTGNDADRIQQMGRLYERARYDTSAHWITRAFDPAAALREKMTYFWMNHFVVVADKVFLPQLMYRYVDGFRRRPWGDFRRMTKDVTIAPAMLIYLDGKDNRVGSPNENYARELMELFTLGVTDRDGAPNYTEQDVQEMARALTGWTVFPQALGPELFPAVYFDADHDGGPKRLFGGAAANFGLAAGGGAVVDVIDYLFDTKGEAIAWFVCEKLYRFFVYSRTDGAAERSVIAELATLFRAADFELRPVLERLLSSAHFYDPANRGVLIKSPLEYLLGLMHALGVPLDREGVAGSVYYLAWFEGQRLQYPPNVKGWLGHRRWLSTTTLALRDVVVATNLAIGGRVGDTVDDGNGNTLEPLLLSDDTLLAFARAIPAFDGEFDAFLDALLATLCANAPSARARANMVARLPANHYEWPGLPEREKIPSLRLLLNDILKLAEYQLS